MLQTYAPAFILIVSVVLLAIVKRKLTIAGALTGGIIALLLFLSTGYFGVLLLGLFFILGTASTSWQFQLKQRLGLSEKRDVKRTAWQVLANGGVAGFCGLLILLYPQFASLFQLMIAGSLSAATADTLSSELGNVYGTRFYNVLTFKKDTRGLNGVVSMEGTLAGILGSFIIAIVYAMGFGWDVQFLIILLAGTVGNFTDSFLGATLERSHKLNNNAVNFFNTLVGAFTAFLLYLLL